MAASLMTLTGRRNAAAKSKPIQPGPRLTGSVIGCPDSTGPGKPIRDHVLPVLRRGQNTIHHLFRAQFGTDGNLRGFSCPEASIFTLVPPISTTKIFMQISSHK